MTALHISTQFDSGAIEVLSLEDPSHIELNIRPDNASTFAQWFHFALHGAAGKPVTLRFLNAGACAYPDGWSGYRVVASHDRQHWFRIDTEFDGTVMTARTRPECNCIYFAYFEPYSYEQHLDLLASAAQSAHVDLERLGSTLDGRDMTLVKITDALSATPTEQKKTVWLIARQHSRVLLERCAFYVVPHMNPDGAVRGNLRTNAAGANLNREWAAPSMDKSPEVFLVRQKMLQTGVDLCLDVHGDEALPYNFVVGSEGNPGYTERVAAQEHAFKAAWLANCPDFQDQVNYGRSEPGTANPTLATNWVAQQFGCLAFTIEMPFKDNAQHPNIDTGWSGERSRKLGASVLQPLLATLR